jgi:hypothetical protein
VAVLAAFIWLITLAAFYALTQDQPYLEENVAAGGVAILGAVVVMVAGSKWETDGIRLPAKKLAELYKVPVLIAHGVSIVTIAILRAIATRTTLRGRMHEEPFPFGDQNNGNDIGRRALESYLRGVGPNSMLVRFEKEKDEVLIHVLK